ncbi:hypothetical protein [Streptomyces sp. NPDC058295]|uniref:hypothetical protein n=1 Tax=Streptomyces sp. NPDC058295 TaxID=3346431 RepID=UPI0036DFE2F4
MGERLNDGAGHSRRRAHPVDAADDEATTDTPGTATPPLEALLVQALTAQAPSPQAPSPQAPSPQALPSQAPRAEGVRGPGDGERRAVAAFRAARDAGAHRARTRRRDDWRPRARRHTARSLRATLSVLVAGLTLGGVAFAAVGSSTNGVAAGAGRPEPAATLPGASGARSADTVSARPRPPAADRDRPLSAEDTDAHCRAYEKVLGRGKATDSTAWQRLVTAAGGAENVVAYCEAATAAATASKSASKSAAESGSAGGGAKSGKSPKADKTPEAGAGKTQQAEPAPKAGKTPGAGQSAKATKATRSGAEGR